MSDLAKIVTIGDIVFPSYSSTEGVAVDLFLSGCNRQVKCPGCYNPELWDKHNETRIFEVVRAVRDIQNNPSRPHADSIAVMGGEPLHQENLYELLAGLATLKKPIWLYTSYELDEIPDRIKTWCDFIKTGTYKQDLRTPVRSRLASYNQKIFKRVNRCGEFSLFFGWDDARMLFDASGEVFHIRPSRKYGSNQVCTV